jgi:hypothetical protein
LIQKLQTAWSELDFTVEEVINLLETLGTIQLTLQNKNDKTKNITINNIPTPRKDIEQLFKLAKIEIPEITPAGKTKKIKSAQQKSTKNHPNLKK